MTEQAQEQVAKTLSDSGIFDKILHNLPCEACEGSGTRWLENPDEEVECGHCDGSGEDRDRTDLLTADQAEAILVEMKCDVSWDRLESAYRLRKEYWDYFDTSSGYDGEWNTLCRLEGIERGQRTLANNSAIAWCCGNMRAELELAIKEVGDGK